MKTYQITIVALLSLAVVNCQDFLIERYLQQNPPALPEEYPENVNITYSSTLACGACVRGGYIYCYKGSEGEVQNTAPAAANQKCCQTEASCTEATNTAWSCSNLYTDKTFGKNVCPFIKPYCGNSSTITLNNVGEK